MTEPDALLELFSRYNPAIWPLQILSLVAAVGAIVLIAARPSRGTDRLVVGLLTAMWLFIGVVFQGVYVAEIDLTLAVVYAAAFVAQAALFVALGVVGERISFRIERTPAAVVGGLAVGYALVVYPLIGIALGHPYPEAPLFGAAPCPSTIFTFGLLLLARPPVPKVLLVVPLFWALVATPAAVGRGVLEDVLLLVTALVATALIVVRDRSARRRATPVARAAVVGLVLVALVGCSGLGGGPLVRIGSAPYERGSGTLATETRPLPDFHALVAGHGIAVEVTTAESSLATVTADDNLLDSVTTEVRDGVLHIELGGSIETSNSPAVSVSTSRTLDAVTATAAATVRVGGIVGTNLAVHAASAASVTADGSVDHLDLTVEAGATADLGGLAATTARADLAAAATATVRVADRISGSCSAGSTLHVLGDPAVVDVGTDPSSTVVRGG